jgi:PTH1 family peptidyl-tRNA hydrolase
VIPGIGKAYLLKPMDFMNRSGFAVQRTAQFHEVSVENVLVVHDEVDLPFGVVRLKNGGGHGGHNGLRSIHEQFGGNAAYARVRMGIGRDPNLPPGKQGDTAGWVLGDFPSAQASALAAMLAAGCDDIEAVLARGIVPAMNAHNARPAVT